MTKLATFAAALAVLLVPVGLALAGQQVFEQDPGPKTGPVVEADPNIVVPDVSRPSVQDYGLRAHTNHLIYVGPPTRRDDAQDFPEVATHGPAVFFFAGPAGYHPADIRTAYGLPSTGGVGAIAIVDAYHYATSLKDFNVFATQFGLATETSTNATAATNKVFQVVFQGTAQPSANAGWGQEAALDIEWAHALAPSAKIYLVEANSANLNDLFASAQKAAGLAGVKEVSMSFGANEFSTESSYDSYFVHTGVVFFASAGDTGGVKSYPAISPNVVGVGGTTLHLTTAGAFSTETAWNGSGGGNSTYLTRPSYQSGISTIVGTHRGCPDVSLVADPNTGVSVYDSTPSGGLSGWMVFGGTSVSSPCIAAITNLSNHSLASSSAELTRIYSELGKSPFRDITSGTAGSFTAKAGWDFITGVGSPVGTTGL